MNRFFRGISLALAALGLLLSSTSAFAVMTYDLRFADGSRSKTAAVGTYPVELYAVIDRGNHTYDDEYIRGGLVTLFSKQLNGGAITPGTFSGVTSRVPPSTVLNPTTLDTLYLQLGTTTDQPGDLWRDLDGNPLTTTDRGGEGSTGNPDGILDWGADERYIRSAAGATATNPLMATFYSGNTPLYPNSAPTRAYNWRFAIEVIPGYAIGRSSNLRPNSWEVLIGQFTITINSVNFGTNQDKTTFTPFSYHRNRASSIAPSPAAGMNYGQDGVLTAGLNPGGINTPFLPNSFTGVEFIAPQIPEPSLVALAACALLGWAGYGLRRHVV
ncbi:MAG: hypothetical protein SFX18_12550 [Pirellulales bacterium]|nr:hypothetical protein [Pirellulales bacterium]